MKVKILFGLLTLSVALAIGVYWFLNRDVVAPSSIQTFATSTPDGFVDAVEPSEPIVEVNTIDEFERVHLAEFKPEVFSSKDIATTSTKSLIKFFIPASGASSSIVLKDSVDTGLYLGSIDFSEESLMFSPDRRYISLVSEQHIVVLDTESLTPKVVFEPAPGTLHGLLTAYPFFVPFVRWSAPDMLEVTIYSKDVYMPYPEEPMPASLEVRTITVR